VTTPDPLSIDAFRDAGHALIDWLADFHAGIAYRPIRPDVAPGEIRSRLPAAAPEEPEPFGSLLADLDDVVVPGLLQWQHPGWFGYFPSNTSPASILGELASAGLGVQGMLWATSPAATEIESHVLDWLVDLMGLPATWRVDQGPGGGVIQMSASDSTHTAHVVARDIATRDGAATDDVVAYASAQAHSSVEKGARVAGYRHVRLVEVDGVQALRPQALAAAIASDLAAGLRPAIVTSAIGTTGTAAVDPVAAIADLAVEHGLWHHVDAAYAGSAMLCEEFRHHQVGVDRVDSYTWNPHKWLFTNFDCSVFWVADRAPLIRALSILPPYLRNAASDAGEVVDYRDWHVPLGRRFRALKLWWVLRSFGAADLRLRIREHVRLARELADRIEAHPNLRVVSPVHFGLVCFEHADGDAATDRVAAAVNLDPGLYVTPSVLDDRHIIRVAIGQARTTAHDTDRLWAVINATA